MIDSKLRTNLCFSTDMSPTANKEDALMHFSASGIAAIINFPLWRASAIAQAGFKVEGSNFLIRYAKAVVQPPFKGLLATIVGMVSRFEVSSFFYLH